MTGIGVLATCWCLATLMRVFFPWEAEVEVCNVIVKSKAPRAKRTSNEHGKLEALEAESVGESHLAP